MKFTFISTMIVVIYILVNSVSSSLERPNAAYHKNRLNELINVHSSKKNHMAISTFKLDRDSIINKQVKKVGDLYKQLNEIYKNIIIELTDMYDNNITYTLINNDKISFTVENIQKYCGCTEVIIDWEVIKPGELKEITFIKKESNEQDIRIGAAIKFKDIEYPLHIIYNK